MLKSAIVVGLNVCVKPMATLLLFVSSSQRSLQNPVPNGSWARLVSFQNENRPKIRFVVLIFWSTRATYSSTFPPVLAALMKLLVRALLVGNGMNWSRKADVGLIRSVGITLPAKGVRVHGTLGSAGHVGSTDNGS